MNSSVVSASMCGTLPWYHSVFPSLLSLGPRLYKMDHRTPVLGDTWRLVWFLRVFKSMLLSGAALNRHNKDIVPAACLSLSTFRALHDPVIVCCYISISPSLSLFHVVFQRSCSSFVNILLLSKYLPSTSQCLHFCLMVIVSWWHLLLCVS